MEKKIASLAFFMSAAILLAPLQTEGGMCGGILGRISELIRPGEADMKANETISVKMNEQFTVELEQALNPSYEWRCTRYDEGYVELVDEGFKASSDPDRLGVTVKYFRFRALKRGTTELNFAYGSIDASGGLSGITRERSYAVKIS
jgi:predicted secreted protein